MSIAEFAEVASTTLGACAGMKLADPGSPFEQVVLSICGALAGHVIGTAAGGIYTQMILREREEDKYQLSRI